MARDTISILDGSIRDSRFLSRFLVPGAGTVYKDPFLPDGMSRLELRELPGRWGRTSATATLEEAMQ